MKLILKKLGFSKVKQYFTSSKRVVHTIFGKQSHNISEMDYDAYWRIRPLSGILPRYPIVASLIEENSSVLDIGCGDGGMLVYLKQHKHIQELGIDISQTAVEKAKQRQLNASVEVLENISKVPVITTYDYVTMTEVIEHVSNPEKFLLDAWKLTKKSLILSFPNIAYYPHRLRLLFGKFPLQWAHHPSEHLRFWSIPDFIHWLYQLPLDNAVLPPEIYPSNGFTFGELYQKFPNLFANQIVVCIHKKE